jgi:hypothetical protein
VNRREFVFGVAALLTAGACGDGSSAAPEAGATASVVERGVGMNLAVDRDAVFPGGSIEVIVSVQNLGAHEVRWRAGGCQLHGSVMVIPLVPLTPEADAGIGDDRRLETRFVDTLAFAADRPAPADPLTAASTGDRACQIDHGFAALAPGARLTERATWPALSAGGAALPPGVYTLSSTFPMLGSDTPLIPAAFMTERDVQAVSVEVAIEIEDDGRAHLSARAALRALLAETALGTWVRAGSVDAGDVSVAFEDPFWTVRIRLPTGGSAVGRVDVRSGRPVLESVPLGAPPPG